MLECNRAVLETLDASNEGTIDSESKLIGRVVIEKVPKLFDQLFQVLQLLEKTQN